MSRDKVSRSVPSVPTGGHTDHAPGALRRRPSAGGRPGNLPVSLTSFVGRELEAAAVTRLLGDSRLVTLTGAGGCGKTRLALEVAGALQPAYPGGVWLADLAALTDPTLLVATVATVLGVRERAGQPLTETLTRSLVPRRLLLVLDNCEHLVDVCAELAATLLRACPHLRLLATSRQVLGVAGETVWRVPSLTLPAPDRRLSPPAVAEADAVRLFVERARLVQSDFALTEQNAAVVAQVCRRLDGMPLAIELAAARLNLLTVDQIAARLDDCFRLLTAGSRSKLPRHQTLRATVEWSYGFLSEAERALFARLAAFAGGATLEAIEAVCAGGGIATGEILDLLAQLVDKSLVVAEEQGQEARYRLLETLRQYGWARLAEWGEAASARDRHATCYLALAEQAEPLIRGAEQEEWLARLEAEYDNLRAALEWCLAEAGDAEVGLRLAGALRWFWDVRGPFGEGLAWLERALARASGTASATRAKALVGAALLAWWRGDYGRAIALGEEGLALCRRVEDTPGLLDALVILGRTVGDEGDVRRARSLLEECLALARATRDRDGIAQALHHLGRLACYQGDYAAARVLLEEGLALFRALGQRKGMALALNYLGLAAAGRGDYARARAHHEEGLALMRTLGMPRGVALSLISLGQVARLQGDTVAACSLYADGLALYSRTGDPANIAWALEGWAGLAMAQGRMERAARLFGAAEGLRTVMQAPIPPVERLTYQRDLAAVRAGLDEAAFAMAWAAGQELELEEAIAEALTGAVPAISPAAVPPVPTAALWASPLSRREREVALLVARGLSNPQIGAALSISERTAEGHVGSILNKLGYTSRAQIAAWVAEQGWLTAPPG